MLRTKNMELPNASKLFLFIQTNPESVCPIIDYSSHRLFNNAPCG